MAAAEVLKFQLTRIYAATNAVFYGVARILFFTFIVFAVFDKSARLWYHIIS